MQNKRIGSIEHRGEMVFFFIPSRPEIAAMDAKSLTRRAALYLGKIINKAYSVNDFTGNIRELDELINQIREEMLK